MNLNLVGVKFFSGWNRKSRVEIQIGNEIGLTSLERPFGKGEKRIVGKNRSH